MANQISNLSMKLFGIPYQFPPAVDPRLKQVSSEIGRNYVENILTEAPVCTIIPGIPNFLPAAETAAKKLSTGMALIDMATNGFSHMKSIKKELEQTESRIYDFSQAYTTYMSYVNVLCQAGATFLELTETNAFNSGGTFQSFDWRAYKWNKQATQSGLKKAKKVASKSFKFLMDEIAGDTKDKTNTETNKTSKSKKNDSKSTKSKTSTISNVAFGPTQDGGNLADDKKSDSKKSSSKKSSSNKSDSKKSDSKDKNADKKESDEASSGVNDNLISVETTKSISDIKSNEEKADEKQSLKDIAKNYSFVQFYIDPKSQPIESLSNTTGQSQFKSLFDSGTSLMKEVEFMANSGGTSIDSDTIGTLVEGASDALNTGVKTIFGDTQITGALSRIINLGGNLLKGENIVVPDIYQNSKYSRSYSITIHLKTPYGTKLGYYLDIFVPLMHLIALTAPRQESANSFSSPFLVKAYVDGIFSCNLGIVSDLSISRSTSSWSTNGLPSEVDVNLTITDLYSGLMITPKSAPIQFLHNSSLIEYLATNCGLDLTAPNLSEKLELQFNTTIGAIKDIPTNINSYIKEEVGKTISKLTSLI